ncbi:MAG: DHA2 family efflux MFS transporter permease subunit [Dethiobacter sp.]|jgi:EmrB/QacA subfamily drug resistance transporter|nr:MAG: DHA2 family efflux MFS transporter permease subunit [Dethiobacter sp.]
MDTLTDRKKIVVMIAIMATLLFVGLNQTTVSTAMPRIIAVLGGMHYFNWVFTIFMLASSVTPVLVGKLSDIYGRKPFLLAGLAIFIAGSFFAGLSGNIFQLIVSRGIQGLGGGMILSTSFAAVGDLFSPRERARWQGLMSGIFGLASVFGPTLGGYLVDKADWRWVFWVFLPVGVIAFLLIIWLFPAAERRETEAIDYLGSLLLTIFAISLLLAFTWGGTRYTWDSREILGLLTVSLLALGVFFLVESRVKSPVIPLGLFKNKTFTISNFIGCLIGTGMFSTIMYMPLFIQGVMGASATLSGIMVMPKSLSMMIASAVSGQVVTQTGKYKKLALLGLAVTAAGMFLMVLMNQNTTIMVGTLTMVVVGIGLGISIPIFTLTTQNAVDYKQLGVATATFQMFRQLGGTIGVSFLGIVMNYRLTAQFNRFFNQSGLDSFLGQDPEAANMLSVMQNPQVLMNPEELAQIQPALSSHLEDIFLIMTEMLRSSLSHSLAGVFAVGGVIMLVALSIGFFLEEIQLKDKWVNKSSDPSLSKEM